MTATLSYNESNCGGRGGCLGFFALVFFVQSINILEEMHKNHLFLTASRGVTGNSRMLYVE